MNNINRKKTIPKNRLATEKSPYLLQHAENPVDWYPWGEEAFTRAQQENKPILLSIGYSACHWCHVMAHESFENEQIASFMNNHFVNIKVDREEYPDVDHFYQTFVQMTTGRGGWPLTVFLTPHKVPFYGGTYFPATPRYGMISFPELLQRIDNIYQNEPQKIQQNAEEIRHYFQELERRRPNDQMPDSTAALENFYHYLKNSFDQKYGGFTPAPKFPPVNDMKFLLAYYHYTGVKEAREMVLFTLRKMASGGIYDQIGGGFHRYSTDEKWLVPHFEKMLYDNALLIGIYADAFRLTGEEFFLRIAQDTANFVQRELTDPAGGFYSSLDADSEGREGKYYLWSYDELKELLDEDLQEIFCTYYNISPAGNFEGENILHIKHSLESLMADLTLNSANLKSQLEETRLKLLQVRSRRLPPVRDNKILSDWNGMMISALWQVYQITGKDIYRASAEKALQYIIDNFIQSDGSLLHLLKDSSHRVMGYIDDYAFVIQSLLDGFEVTQNRNYFERAFVLSTYVLQNFWDEHAGGFYFSDHRYQNVFVRLKQVYDTATPAGNHVMCSNLLRLYYYTGKEELVKKIELIFQAAKSDIENHAATVPSLMTALLFYHFSPVEIILSLTNKQEKFTLKTLWHNVYLPNKIVVQVIADQIPEFLNPLLFKDRMLKNRSALFICQKSTCFLPVFDADQFFECFNKLNLKIN